MIEMTSLPTRGVMIPFFSGTGIITGIIEKEPESESHGIDSKVESIPGLESIPRLESIPYVESAPVHEQGQTIICLPPFLTNSRIINRLLMHEA